MRYELDPTLRRVVRITPDGLILEAHERLHKAGQLDHASARETCASWRG